MEALNLGYHPAVACMRDFLHFSTLCTIILRFLPRFPRAACSSFVRLSKLYPYMHVFTGHSVILNVDSYLNASIGQGYLHLTPVMTGIL